MNPPDELVQKFFEDYERGIRTSDTGLLAELYSETFLFANAQGSFAVEKEGFLKMLPKREAFFKATGLVSTSIRALEETRLDDHYSLVKVYWTMRFEKDPQHPILDANSATYLLYRQENTARIVFQLDHQDLMKRAQELGVLPPKD